MIKTLEKTGYKVIKRHKSEVIDIKDKPIENSDKLTKKDGAIPEGGLIDLNFGLGGP